ncbi:MAG: hypothetical protein SH850_20590 [Planctomycetaceae bacterium]|nr:hypothetical protein [Planctomycetaceae bacterium]
MDPLAFASPLVYLPPRDLLTWDKDDMPRSPGVYVLIAEKSFTYPGGESPVFYIGAAPRLRRRLRQHKIGVGRAARDRKHAIYPPPWEYAAKFGVKVAIAPVVNPRVAEFQLLARFAKEYRSLPVANSTLNRRMVRKLFPAQRDDIATEGKGAP